MNGRTRAERRHAAARAKQKAVFKMRHIFHESTEWITPKRIGMNAAMHGTCDCYRCTSKYDTPARLMREAVITREDMATAGQEIDNIEYEKEMVYVDAHWGDIMDDVEEDRRLKAMSYFINLAERSDMTVDEVLDHIRDSIRFADGGVMSTFGFLFADKDELLDNYTRLTGEEVSRAAVDRLDQLRMLE